MKLKEFLDMYDNWNDVICVNDDNLGSIVREKPDIALLSNDIGEKTVVSFGFYDNGLCVRVR